MTDGHYTLMFERDEDGWWMAQCRCGWRLPASVPDADLAADAYGDHRADVALAAMVGR